MVKKLTVVLRSKIYLTASILQIIILKTHLHGWKFKISKILIKIKNLQDAYKNE